MMDLTQEISVLTELSQSGTTRGTGVAAATGKEAVEVGPLARGGGGEFSKEKLDQGHTLGMTGPPFPF